MFITCQYKTVAFQNVLTLRTLQIKWLHENSAKLSSVLTETFWLCSVRLVLYAQLAATDADRISCTSALYPRSHSFASSSCTSAHFGASSHKSKHNIVRYHLRRLEDHVSRVKCYIRLSGYLKGNVYAHP